MANNAKGTFFRLTTLLVAMALLFGAMPFGVSAAPWDREEDEDRGNWTYAYYLGQEYLANASGAAVKPDPVGYGFQGVITELTFVDDAGKSWTFVWSSEANGEWRITGNNVTEEVATAWPQVTDGGRYVGYCNGTAYTFTLSSDGSAKDWTYARGTHANWFYYIRFIRKYTVNVFYQNETGTVEYNGVTYAVQDPLVREFNFLYPNGNIIDDSEYEDGEYTDPITLLPADYLSQAMVDQGYELKYATDGDGNDVLQTGVTISLLGTNVLNVYCTLIPPQTENYEVIHKYYTNGDLDGSQSGGNIEVAEGADFANVVENIEKLPDYSDNTYEYTSYQVDPQSKTIELTYIRTVDPEPPTEPTEPTEPPTEPTEPPTEPTEPPTEPTEPPTEPTEPPTEPTEPPTEPTEPPTEPTEPPTEPTEPPTEPTEPPTEPTEPPTEPTEPPTEPTEPPTEPTEPPTEPTEPPTEPTEPPTEPTEPPTEATEPPVEKTEPPTDPVMPLDDEGDAAETTEPPAVVDVPVTGGTLSVWIMISAVSGICLAGTLLTRKKED